MTKIIKINFIILCAILLCVSCGRAAKNVALGASYDAQDTAATAALENLDAQDEEYYEDEDYDPSNIDFMILTALALCEEEEFARADSLLKSASQMLMHSRAETTDEDDSLWAEEQDYIENIIIIYTELMPPEFSLPDEISTLFFKYELFSSLADTLKMSQRDSVFLARLSNKRGVVYDVPMVWNDRVMRALLFHTRTRTGVFDRWLNRAGYYLPAMQQMFADAGLPQDLAYLPIIESGFNPHATSRMRAAGIWQFIPSTGRNYGLRQNYFIDERRDPLKSTAAAIAYLDKLYKQFGDWHIALAAYNCGENGMARAIRRAGGVHDYWQLQLPRETMNYVPLYLSSVMIAKNPDVFEFAIQDTMRFDYDTVHVHDCIMMSTIAEGIGVELAELRRLNPHILQFSTPPDMRNIRLYLPRGKAEAFHEFYANLPADKKTKFYRYRVQSGDNMLGIARDFRVPVEALRAINNMRNNHIVAGKYLIIPIPADGAAPSSRSAHIDNGDAPQTTRTRTARPQPTPPTQAELAQYKGRYVVKSGDTLYDISIELGVPLSELARINGLSTRRPLIFPGDVLIYKERGD